jgi:NADH-quinone oxidoreductase subunit F
MLHRIQAGQGRKEDLDEILRLSKFIDQQSFCPFGPAAVWGIRSAINRFRPEIEEYIERTNPAHVMPTLPVRPIYRPDTGAPAHERD